MKDNLYQTGVEQWKKRIPNYRILNNLKIGDATVAGLIQKLPSMTLPSF